MSTYHQQYPSTAGALAYLLRTQPRLASLTAEQMARYQETGQMPEPRRPRSVTSTIARDREALLKYARDRGDQGFTIYDAVADMGEPDSRYYPLYRAAHELVKAKRFIATALIIPHPKRQHMLRKTMRFQISEDAR